MAKLEKVLLTIQVVAYINDEGSAAVGGKFNDKARPGDTSRALAVSAAGMLLQVKAWEGLGISRVKLYNSTAIDIDTGPGPAGGHAALRQLTAAN